MRPPRPAGPPPDRESLQDAALMHLARFATTRAGLLRVLERRVERWATAARAEAGAEPIGEALAAARATARDIVAALADAGAVDDAAFAVARARRLIRAGRSRRAAAAHLAAKGVEAETARAALPEDPEVELEAALTLARRRRIGPFRTGPVSQESRRELAILARAGFSQEIAARALGMEPEEAERRVLRLRRE